ncbi:hypothetical protein NB16F96_21890 [Escherichia coli]
MAKKKRLDKTDSTFGGSIRIGSKSNALNAGELRCSTYVELRKDITRLHLSLWENATQSVKI